MPVSSLLSLLLASTAAAQNFRSFRPALTYQLSEAATPGDTTHLLRLGTGQPQGADSLFAFDPRTSRGGSRPAGPCGRYVQRPDNLFRAALRVRPGAEYVLSAANGRTFTLRPRQPLGQPWAATAAGLTARVTARTLGAVLGQADSLVAITLSDGAVLTLSRRFGWVSGPALGRYLNPRLPAAVLTLTALPERGLGAARLGAFAVYDFQPGDVFLRKTTDTSYLGPGVPCTNQVWVRDSILSRILSADGDTLRYQVRRRTLTRACGASPPVLSPFTVQTLRITRATEYLDQPTGFWGQLAATGTAGMLHLPAARTADYYGRPVQQHLLYLKCGAPAADTTSLADASGLDNGYHVSTAPGLGQTQTEYLGFTTQITTLLGYRKGAETWGQLTTFVQLLPARSSRPAASTAALPNPFGPELTVRLTLDRPQAVRAELRDALGRPVPALGSGPQQVVLSTAGLPAGLYTLHLHAEGRTEVFKVLKGE